MGVSTKMSDWLWSMKAPRLGPPCRHDASGLPHGADTWRSSGGSSAMSCTEPSADFSLLRGRGIRPALQLFAQSDFTCKKSPDKVPALEPVRHCGSMHS